METKLTKGTASKVKNKELTKRSLINAVGELLRTTGFEKLLITRVAKQADVNPTLVYRYFGNISNLIEQYVIEKDYWVSKETEIQEKNLTSKEDIQETAIKLLQNQFTFFYDNDEMQRLILTEVNEHNAVMNSISRVREHIGSAFFKKSDNYLNETKSDIRTVSALLVGGIYYTILHSRSNSSTFCEIDLKKQGDRDRVLRAIRRVMTRECDEPGLLSDKI